MNKDLFPNSHVAEIICQMQEGRNRNISLPNEEVLRQMEQIKQNVSSPVYEILRIEKERHRSISGDLFSNSIGRVDNISELVKSFQLERQDIMSSSLAAMFENHSKDFLDYRKTLSSTLLPGILSANSAAIDSIKNEMGRYAISIAQNFMESVQFKDLFKMTQFDAAKIFESAAVSAFLPSQKDLISNLLALQSSWSASSIALNSIEGMTGLMSLRNAVITNPFGDLERDAFQNLLGSWDNTKLTKSILFDADVRKAFYLDQGFDERLTSFPANAYSDALFQSGLLRPDLFSPSFSSTEMGYYPLEEDERGIEDNPELEEQKEYKARLLRAYDIISNLEIRLREFLISEMEKLSGQSWMKQRIPGDIHAQWKLKRDSAVKKGEEEQPIIWYADFTDYERIITRKDNWKDAFEGKFINVMDIQVSFQRLYPIRNCTMHTRPLTKEDFLLLTVETQRILHAIGEIEGHEDD